MGQFANALSAAGVKRKKSESHPQCTKCQARLDIPSTDPDEIEELVNKLHQCSGKPKRQRHAPSQKTSTADPPPYKPKLIVLVPELLSKLDQYRRQADVERHAAVRLSQMNLHPDWQIGPGGPHFVMQDGGLATKDIIGKLFEYGIIARVGEHAFTGLTTRQLTLRIVDGPAMSPDEDTAYKRACAAAPRPRARTTTGGSSSTGGGASVAADNSVGGVGVKKLKEWLTAFDQGQISDWKETRVSFVTKNLAVIREAVARASQKENQ